VDEVPDEVTRTHNYTSTKNNVDATMRLTPCSDVVGTNVSEDRGASIFRVK
jgi:hypothetical protein